MCEKDEDGFIPVLEEKELTEGTMEKISVQEIPILLIRLEKNGEVFALSGQCPHTDGVLKWYGGDQVTCYKSSCKNMRFDIKTGENTDPDLGLNLVKYDCKIKNGKIWVRLQE